MKNMLHTPDFLWNNLKMRRMPVFLAKSWQVLCPIDLVCDFVSKMHNSKSSSFHLFMN